VAARALALLLLVAVAAAEGEVRPTPEQKAQMVRIVGKKQWGQLPPWRQRMVLERYRRFLRAPERQQAAIRHAGLREFLLQIRGKDKSRHLPPTLGEELGRLAPDARPLAAKLAFMRLRQLRLDRALHHVPLERRWEVFGRLFPEPFDQKMAKRAHAELRNYIKQGVAAKVRKILQAEDLPPAERMKRASALVRQATEEEERKVVAKIRKELFRFHGADPKRVRRLLERHGFHLLEQIRFATPRQRELIRYAFRPDDCPLLDLGFLGPRPGDPAERRLWERDFRVFARLELLTAAGFPREMVLYLAGTGSPEDFFRAVKMLRRPQPDPLPKEPRK
ncbi:MAG: hypothetical protein ACYTFD_16655, partial [Planctomycetota bacterium]|jgi:hypothetical protein